MEQGVKYVLTLEDLLSPKVRSAEANVLGLESAINSLNSNVMGLATTFGVAFGVREIYEFGKSIVETAANFEQSMLRIKYGSENLNEGLKNQQFILSEVDKFRIPVMEATEAYGKFLSMIGSTGLASEKVRTLHDDLLTTAKIKGISDAQMNTAVMDLGKMIESGVADARHLRGFGYQLNGIMPYIAKELKISTAQLAQDIHHGKSVDISTDTIISAIHKQAADLAQYLPEATQSIRSELNDTANEWLKFKDDIGESLKPEMVAFFTEVRSGIGWMREHKEGLIQTSKVVIELTKLYLEYKLGMIALGAVQGVWNLAVGTQLTQQAAAITQTQLQTTAILELTAALEALAAANTQATVATGLLYDAQGAVIMSSTLSSQIAASTAVQAERAALMSGGALMGAGTRGLGAMAGATIMPVFVAGMAAEVIASMIPNNPNTGRGWDVLFGQDAIGKAILNLNSQVELGQSLASGLGMKPDPAFTQKNISPYSTSYALTHPWLTKDGMKGNGASNSGGLDSNASHINSNTDKITGQRAITYNIRIDKQIGINEVHTTNVRENVDSVAHEVKRVMSNIVNDSQIKDNE